MFSRDNYGHHPYGLLLMYGGRVFASLRTCAAAAMPAARPTKVAIKVTKPGARRSSDISDRTAPQVPATTMKVPRNAI